MKVPQPPVLRQVKRYRPWITTKEIPLTILGVLWFLLCSFSVSLVNVYLDHHNPYLVPPSDERIRLTDPLLDSLYPGFVRDRIPKDISDSLVYIAPFFMLLRVALGGSDSFLVLRRLGYLVGTGYLIRIFFIMMTILPNSNVNCHVVTTSLLNDALLVMLQLKHTCGDVVFSGHTIMFMSASLVWIENPLEPLIKYPTCRHLINLFLVIYSFGGILSLVASAYHYTVDCVISVFTMLFLWKFYHYVVTRPHLDGTYISRFLCHIDGQRRFNSLNSSTTMNEFSNSTRTDTTNMA